MSLVIGNFSKYNDNVLVNDPYVYIIIYMYYI